MSLIFNHQISFLKARRKITQEFFKDISHLKILINKNIWFLNQDLFLGVIQGTGAICLSQILISFPFVFLNNRNKVMGIKLRHREKDPSHWLSQPSLTVLLCDKCLFLSSIIYQREINCIYDYYNQAIISFQFDILRNECLSKPADSEDNYAVCFLACIQEPKSLTEQNMVSKQSLSTWCDCVLFCWLNDLWTFGDSLPVLQ